MRARLRPGTLSLTETLGQSVANIAPTLTPALNIVVVAGLAGVGSWLSYLIATVGLMFVGGCIATLAKRHQLSGSYFVYIGRTLGPMAGLLAGWSMIGAYLFTAVAVTLGVVVFLDNFLAAIGMDGAAPPPWLVAIWFLGTVFLAAYRDIKLSSRLGLALEAVSIGIMVVIMTMAAGRHGTVLDPVQISGQVRLGPVMSSLTFAVFSFVGFESAATLAKEARDPGRAIPLAVIFSCGAAGLFFTAMTYLMMMASGDDAARIAGSASPFTDMTQAAGLPGAAAVVYFAALISGFACALASVNAAARMIFSMARFRFFHGRVGDVHRTHRTPHIAVGLSVGVTLAATLAMLPLGALDAFGYAGTFGTFGFLVVYLMVCVVSPLDLHRDGLLRPVHLVTALIGGALMLFVIAGSLYPVPDYPSDLIPYLFAAYMLAGFGWSAVLRRYSPAVLVSMEHDLEEV